MNGTLHVAVCFDERYSEHAQATIGSLVRNASAQDPAAVTIWVGTRGPFSREAANLMERAAGDRAEVRSVTPALPPLPGRWSAEAGHVSEAMYLRLGLIEALPDDVERILYLDCDTLVMGSLSPLLSVDLGDNPLGAVRDAFTRRVVDRGGLPGWQRYPRISGQDPYFNSGVLLIDTASWRRLDVSGLALEYLRNNAGQLRYPDQDALNIACAGRWTRLPARWNHMMPWRLESANGGTTTDAVIAHCAGPRKWWGPDYPPGDLSTYYRSMLPM